VHWVRLNSRFATDRAGYRRFRCRARGGKQFNERSASLLNRTQYPSHVIALVGLQRFADSDPRYRVQS
jgi:hypothetical protein